MTVENDTKNGSQGVKMKDGLLIEDTADAITTFAVGPPDQPLIVRFVIVTNDGSQNIQALDPLPPLNINGLRRLAKHLSALADLLEFSTPARDIAKAREARRIVDEIRNRPAIGEIRDTFRG